MKELFQIDALKLGPMDNIIYLVHDNKNVAIVDPAWEVDKILAFTNSKKLKITDILLTHGHPDHVNGVDELSSKCNAKIHIHKDENKFWNFNFTNTELHEDGDIIYLGETPIKIIHTSGHTPGSICYHIGNKLLTGDTLFVDGCGRCDLPGGEIKQMYDSLHKLATLPAETQIFPGHHYSENLTATIAEQLKSNPYMRCNSYADFVLIR
jgi:hydroxyacylglutathione hydrolase